MFPISMPELSILSKSEKKAALRACRWKPFRHWQYWLSLIMYLPCAPLFSIALGSVYFMVFIISRFDLQIFLLIFLLPLLASMFLFYSASKIHEYYLSPLLLRYIADNHPNYAMMGDNEHSKFQRKRKKAIFISIPAVVVILALCSINIYRPASYTPRPIPVSLKEPRVEINKIGLTKGQKLRLPGLGKVTDIIKLQDPNSTGANLAIAGTEGAVLVDEQLSVKRQIKYDGKSDPISVVNLNKMGDLGYISRGSWCCSPYLIDSNGKHIWTYEGGNSGVDDMVAGDVNGDGQVEYVVGYNGGGGIHLLNADGKKVWSKPDGNVWHVEIADTEGDGHQNIVHSNAAGVITIRGSEGQILAKHKPETYFSHFSIINLPAAEKNIPNLLLNSDEKIWILNFKGQTIKQLPSPFSCDGHAKGTMATLASTDAYLSVIVDAYIWDRSVLYLYNSSDQLIYQEILPEACFSIYAFPTKDGLHQSLLVGCKNVVWQYTL